MIETANDMSIDEFNEWKRTGRFPDRFSAPRKATTESPQAQQPTHRFSGLAKGHIATRGRMNGTEQRWSEVLEGERLAGAVRRWWFEPMKLRLTDPAPGQRAIWFTADFLIELADGGVLVDDVKGGMVNEGSIVRMKTAATLFSLWRFRIVTKVKKADGTWKILEL